MKKELLSLRPSDVLTKNQLARTAQIQVDFAESILIDLFKEKLLRLIIRVDCYNDDQSHSLWFNSLEEYYKASRKKNCESCGANFDWKNAKVGFKRGIYR
ncbi:hypothetical protein V7115_14715 [Priestia megaterium]